MADFVRDPDWVAPPQVLREDLPGGGFVLRSPEALQPYARCVGEWLEHWAAATPGADALAERAPSGDWRRLNWAEVRAAVGALGQALLDLRLPPGAPVVVLSDNAVDHALLMLAAMHVGQPVCTVSSAYSRMTRDHTKLRGIVDRLGPALVYAADGAVYGPALQALDLRVPVVLSRGLEAVPGALALADLLRTAETPAVAAAFAALRPETHAKYLLTSGSTGHPKVVINTHRMLCANQQMIAQTWRFLALEKPVLVDWLPWSHTFGGNHNFNLVLRHGGTLVVDEGRPAPGLIDKTLRNLRECRPTLLFNVPRGLDMMLPALEADEALARDVMQRLRLVFYAGAALTPATWRRLQALADRVQAGDAARADHRLWLTTSWGSTETAPAVTSAHWRLEGAGCIGLPMPGAELKLVPNADKLELRVRGVNVFEGYRGEPELTRQAFDEDGYYRIGDAGHLADPAQPERGVVFNGRVAEDFKLASGTWVSVGTLRVKLVSALAPLAQDAVLTGHDRDEVGALLFPTPAAAALSPQDLTSRVHDALAALRAEGGGSSQQVGRVLWLAEPPSAEAGEITDKGYVNQRAVLSRRTAEVQALYADPPDPRVMR